MGLNILKSTLSDKFGKRLFFKKAHDDFMHCASILYPSEISVPCSGIILKDDHFRSCQYSPNLDRQNFYVVVITFNTASLSHKTKTATLNKQVNLKKNHGK